jgi:uncharacterized DUF497 family protein
MHNDAMNFEFDPAKNRLNIAKHGVDLANVEGVFNDRNALTIEDRDHNEQRFVTIGDDGVGQILVVCYTYREETTVRVISARKAKPHERKDYEG